MKKQIEVIIPAQEYSHVKYTDNKDCYLATALKEQGYEDVSVGGFGYTRIADKGYEPVEKYNSIIVKIAFSKSESIRVILQEQE